MHADQAIGFNSCHPSIEGVAYTGEHLTLIDCTRTAMVSGGKPDGPRRYSASVSPNYVAVGTQHFDPTQPLIRRIYFSTTDLDEIFFDFHAFGLVDDSKGFVDRMLKELAEERAKEVGEHPMVAYFTGRHRIAEVQTAIGKICASHNIRHNFGGPSGVYLKNTISVSIEPSTPLTFDDAMQALADLGLFLSVVAGRSQGIRQIHIQLPSDEASGSHWPRVHMSFPWKVRGASDRYRPHQADVPLDPVQRPKEFSAVLSNWMQRQDAWRVARNQYLSCLRKTNLYGSDRLVAAANMFDLLPKEAVPADTSLPADLAKVRDECAAKFKALPDSVERNSALAALGRLGTPFLTKKVAHRIAMIEPTLGTVFPDLAWVAGLAIKCRNVFVHGPSSGFDIEKMERFSPFFTDALEFIFAASDLIEAGWDANRWKKSSYVGRHSFSSFRAGYAAELAELKQAIKFTG